MPSFDGRRTELRARLTEQSAQLQPIEVVRIAGVLEDFLNLRDSALTTLTTIVADTTQDELAKDYADKCGNFRQQMNQKAGDMLSGLSDPSKAAVLFRERLLVEEVGFWGAPALLGLGAARDDLLKIGKACTEETNNLDKKWQSLSEEDLRVEQAEEDAAKKVTDIIKTSINQQADFVKRAANFGASIMQTAGKIDDKVNEWVVAIAIGIGVPETYARAIPTLSSIAQPTFDEARALGVSAAELAAILAPLLLKDPGFAVVEALKALMGSDIRDLLTLYSSFKKGLIYALQTPYTDQVSFYRGLLPSHTALIVTFTGTRQEVDNFLKNFTADIARQNLDKVFAMLDAWAGSSMTDGQRRDAQQIRTLARDALNTRLIGIVETFNNLYRKYTGRFIGPLSTDTDRFLISTDAWIVTQNGFIELGLDDNVQEWRSEMLDIPAKIGDSFSQVDSRFGDLPLEIRDRIREAVDSYLDQQLRTLNSEAQDAAAALDSCALAVNARKFGTDFDRSDLKNKLYG